MLKELTSRDVKFLNAFRALGDGPDRRGQNGKAGLQDREIYDRSALQTIYAQADLARCSRLGRLTHGNTSEQNQDDIDLDEHDFSIVLDSLMRHKLVEEFIYVTDGFGTSARLLYKYSLSELGVAFVDACQPPSAQGSGS